MARDTRHALQPQTDHDGMSRRLAVLACKQAIRRTLEPALKNQFQAATAAQLEQLPGYPTWASLNRAAQDRMWRLLAEQTDADYDRIARVASDASRDDQAGLDLDPDSPPDYLRAHQIHGQPGGYLLDRGAGDALDGDLGAGILYEAGGNLYALGQGIGKRDSKAQRLIRHIRECWPDLEVRRILELGCAAGGQSADYPLAFPGAECHALDASAAMLRYARARSRELGAAVHYHQGDAAALPFPDDHFDLVISHNLFHEVAAEHVPAILAECHRVLRPGGGVMHQDVPIQLRRLDPWMQALSAWQKDNNDEPFWMDFASADFVEGLADAGFARDRIREEYLEAVDGPIPWYVVSARKG
jgi:ubiquinone/menaquinone biosynthesis C-methylase UbiE